MQDLLGALRFARGFKKSACYLEGFFFLQKIACYVVGFLFFFPPILKLEVGFFPIENVFHRFSKKAFVLSPKLYFYKKK